MAKTYTPFIVPTIAVAQTASRGAYQSSGSNPITFGSNVPSTDAAVAFVLTSGADTPGVSGCGVTSFSAIGSSQGDPGSYPNVSLFLGLNSSGGNKTLTVTAPTTSQWAGVGLDVSGPLMGAPVQSQVTLGTQFNGGGATITSATFNPTQVGQLMVAFMAFLTGGTVAGPSSPWTSAEPQGGLFYAYRLATSSDVASGTTVSWSAGAGATGAYTIAQAVLR